MGDTGTVNFAIIIGVFVLFLMAFLAIVFSILAFIRATDGIPGPKGPTGEFGPSGPPATLNIPPVFVNSDTYALTTLSNSFIIFTANPGAGSAPVQVSLPAASTAPGYQFTLYTPSAASGILLINAPTDASVPLFNPIPINRLAILRSDGVTQWVLNI